MFLSLKTLLLLVPIAWSILHGPNGNVVFVLGGLFATFELLRTGSTLRLVRAWPIFMLVTLYAIASFVGPDVPYFQDPYPWRTALVTVFYAIPGGFCLGLWSRDAGQEKVLWGYVVFCLALAAVGLFLVRAAGPENLVHSGGDYVHRTHAGAQGVHLWIFKGDDIIVDTIPLSIFAVGALPVILLPRLFWPKLVLSVGAALGIYISLSVVTRTMFLAALATAAIMVPLQLRASHDRRKYLWRLLLAGLAATALICVLLLTHATGNVTLLFHRLSQAGQDGRLEIWSESLSRISSYPLGGGITYLRSQFWAHNVILDFLLTVGLPGALPMVALYGFVFASVCVAAGRTDIMTEPVGVALLGGLMASFTASMVEVVKPSWLAFTCLAGCYSLALVDVDLQRVAEVLAAKYRKLRGRPVSRLAFARRRGPPAAQARPRTACQGRSTQARVAVTQGPQRPFGSSSVL